MKKTLAALIVSAVAASAANAAVVYDNEGTKVELKGSLRLVLEKTNKGGDAAHNKHTHSGLRNDGSRVAVKVTHDLADGFYALGNLEVRFDGKQGGTTRDDGFGNVNTKRAYAGFGKKELGELTFGRQLTIADNLSTSKDYTYGIVDKGEYIPTDGNSVVAYNYKGVEHLQLGANYIFADSRGINKNAKGKALDNEVLPGTVENGYQVGAVYEDGFIAKFGYGRTNYKVTGSQKHHQDGFLLSLGYDFNGVTGYVDGGYARIKESGERTNKFFVAPGFIAPVSEAASIYGNYKYEHAKTGDEKTKLHGFLLGVDYKLHKQVVTFIEGKYTVSKDYDANGYVNNSKVKDKAIGVGMRVFF